MRKDITKKFLMRENRYHKKMLSKALNRFIIKKKINIDARQVDYDEIEFRNMFRTKFISIRDTNNLLSLEYNMIHCIGDESHSDFLLGETEVTQELYELVMGYNPSCFKGKKDSKKRPVENVTWYDTIMFCNELSILMRKSPYYEIKIEKYEDNSKSIKEASVKINEGANGFRLPLENEWEYAARAGTNNQWSGTNAASWLGEYAWLNYNSNKQTHPVATKNPNEWGFYDMSGNVKEWCYDLYDKNATPRVVRGGSWHNIHSYMESNSRFCQSPSNRFNTLGFRVAASL